MSLVAQLVGFGLRQVIGDCADNAVQIVGAVEQRFRDHSRTLPKALDQAWQALGVAPGPRFCLTGSERLVSLER